MAYYLTDVGAMAVASMDELRGGLTGMFGGPGSGVGEFATPAAIAFDPQTRRLVVADRDNHRIVALSIALDGSEWETFGQHGSGQGELSGPTGVAVDERGRILIADTGNHRVVRIDDISGAGWTELGALGKPTEADPEAVYGFVDPVSVTVSPTGGAFVADPKAGRVVGVGDLDGTHWAASTGRSIRGPFAVAALSTGELAVGQLMVKAVTIHDDLDARPSAHTEPGVAFSPTAIAEHPEDGSLVFCDITPGRVLRVRREDRLLIPIDEAHVKPMGLPRPFGVCVA